MAFNVQTFKTRALTAAVFVVIMLLGLFWNHWSFFVLFSIIHFGCWLEYQYLVGLIDKEYQQISAFHKYGVMIAGWCIMLYFTNDAYMIGELHLHSLGWWLGLILVFLLPVIELLFAREVKPKNIGYSALGLLYISLSWGLLMDVRSTGMDFDGSRLIADLGYLIPAGLIFAIWINDTMAYIVGSLIGKTPFSSISPKKTWEGTLGGAILCMVIVSLSGWLMRDLPVIHWVMISLIAAVVGTVGDRGAELADFGGEDRLRRLGAIGLGETGDGGELGTG